jgi:hypothetical protein
MAAVDPVSGPLIRLAFELYASGAYTVRACIQALTDAGLPTKPSRRYPNGSPISVQGSAKWKPPTATTVTRGFPGARPPEQK